MRRAAGAASTAEFLLRQDLLELAAYLRVLSSERHRGREVPQLRAAIIACPLEAMSDDALLLQQRRDRIGQLDLAARARLDALDHLEHARGEDVAAHHAHARGRVL